MAPTASTVFLYLFKSNVKKQFNRSKTTSKQCRLMIPTASTAFLVFFKQGKKRFKRSKTKSKSTKTALKT